MNNSVEIHQIVGSVSYGDGISNGTLFIQKLLRELGFKSNIYIFSKSVDINFKSKVYHIRQYTENKQNIVFYHHASYNPYLRYIKKLQDKKIIIYHNITPAHFFDSIYYRNKSERARKQLENLAPSVIGSVGDSEYNCLELQHYNFPNPVALPLLVDKNRHQFYAVNESLLSQYSSTFNIIFVGRVIQNKSQLQLIDLMYWLKLQEINNVRLFIIGSNNYSDYYNYLFSYRDKLCLKEKIIITGKVNTIDLNTYYKLADVYLSLSEHEGFGMPILEAINKDVAVLAYACGDIPSTLGDKGLF